MILNEEEWRKLLIINSIRKINYWKILVVEIIGGKKNWCENRRKIIIEEEEEEIKLKMK